MRITVDWVLVQSSSTRLPARRGSGIPHVVAPKISGKGPAKPTFSTLTPGPLSNSRALLHPPPRGGGAKIFAPVGGPVSRISSRPNPSAPKKSPPRTEPRPSSHRERRGDAPDIHARVHRGAHRRLAHPPPKTAGFSKSGWLRARARTAQVRKPRAAPVPP